MGNNVMHDNQSIESNVLDNKKLVFNRLGIEPQTLNRFCQQHDIAELALFGSVLRNDFNAESDIDLLVTYQPTARRGIFEKLRVIEELESLFQRQVDLVSKKAIERSSNWVRRRNILDSAEVIYVA